MFTRLYRCYYEKGILITDRRKIVFHYLKGLFIIDLVSIFSLIVVTFVKENHIEWITIVFLLKVKKLK